MAELAEAAAESAAAPEAGVASVVAGAVLTDSCFAQAVSISAAIRALRASLVFIDQYPERSKMWREAQQKKLFVCRMHMRTAGAGFYRVAGRLEICVGYERQRRVGAPSRGISTSPISRTVNSPQAQN